MAQHTMEELKIRQNLPLDVKLRMSQLRIREFVSEFGIDGCYVSFSGGKDSTVLMHIVRNIFPEMPAVFIDTGLEYPEIRDFVKTFENIEWLKPSMNFKQVIQKYGYPFISKEVSECVDGARKYLTKMGNANTIAEHSTAQHSTAQHSTAQHSILINSENYVELVNTLKQRMKNREGGANQRLLIMLGELERNLMENIPENRSKFSQVKYKFLLDAPFNISNKCCNVMKKAPAHLYHRKTGRNPITAMMAEESRLRAQKWIQNGCNLFDSKHPISNPLSFWREQDILRYIKENNIRICSVYGEIVNDYDAVDQMENQLTIDEALGNPAQLPLKTSRCKRTGCMFCGFGCHLNDDQRFVMMKETHPKQYDYIMRSEEQGGLNYKAVIDWINEHGNLNIKY